VTESFFRNETSETPQGNIPELNDTPAETADEKETVEGSFQTEEGRMAAILSYIPFLCFIPLLNMRENKEASFHARQGVMLFLIELVAVLFLIDGVSDFVFKAVLIVAIAFSIAGIYFALQGKSHKLPVIGDLAEKTKL
jgi:uncharacterized membrane protein